MLRVVGARRTICPHRDGDLDRAGMSEFQRQLKLASGGKRLIEGHDHEMGSPWRQLERCAGRNRKTAIGFAHLHDAIRRHRGLMQRHGLGRRRPRAHEDIVLDGSGSFDPEGEELAYRWRQVAGPVVELRDANTPWPRFTPTGPGRYGFELVVAAPPEGGRGRALESPPVRLSVDVLPPNRAPRVEVAPLVRAEPGQWAVLDGGGATDADGDVLTFRWERVATKEKGADERVDPTGKESSSTV